MGPEEIVIICGTFAVICAILTATVVALLFVMNKQYTEVLKVGHIKNIGKSEGVTGGPLHEEIVHATNVAMTNFEPPFLSYALSMSPKEVSRLGSEDAERLLDKKIHVVRAQMMEGMRSKGWIK
jgi:hypothetical protein